MYTNIDHARGLHAVSQALQFWGPLYDVIFMHLELSLKYNDFLFNGQWYIQSTGTSISHDLAPHYADVGMANFEEALHKTPLKPCT